MLNQSNFFKTTSRKSLYFTCLRLVNIFIAQKIGYIIVKERILINTKLSMMAQKRSFDWENIPEREIILHKNDNKIQYKLRNV